MGCSRVIGLIALGGWLLSACCGCHCCWRPGPGCCPTPGAADERHAAYYYSHPRFHAIPTRPVFSPRLAAMPFPLAPVPPGGGHAHTSAPHHGSPQIEMILPEAAPEEIPKPQPEREQRDRSTQVPHRLATTADRPSWIFTR